MQLKAEWYHTCIMTHNYLSWATVGLFEVTHFHPGAEDEHGTAATVSECVQT